METVNHAQFFHSERIGRFTSSEMHKLLKGGTRPMTEAEKANREKGDRRTTVDVMFGDGAMTYIYTKVSEHLTGQSADEVNFKAGEWGKLCEPDLIIALEDAGYKVEYFGDNNAVFFKYGQFSGGTPDGRINGTITLEGKCPFTTKEHIRYLMYKTQADLQEDKIEYYAQIQWNMKCMDLHKAFFVSFDPRMLDEHLKLKILTVYRDETFLTELEHRVKCAESIMFDILSQLRKVA